ncbi:MAG: hypothetical protein DSY46_07335 [Hydrogenimonas sp.]|nr:MAG: hypothetical protein DSY46_07335 [Hydrogenimonas sp.]
MSVKKKKVIVLGGGYGGIKAIETLANESDHIDVTLIDKNLYHYLQTESYNFVALNISLNDITIPLTELVQGIDKNFNFIQDEAVNIQDNTLISKHGTYEFDYLIIGVGSITKVPSIFRDKNFYEVKNLSNAIHLKQSFENTLLKHLNNIKLDRIPILLLKTTTCGRKYAFFKTHGLIRKLKFRRPAQSAAEGISHPSRRSFDERRPSAIGNNRWPNGPV